MATRVLNANAITGSCKCILGAAKEEAGPSWDDREGVEAKEARGTLACTSQTWPGG